MIYHSTRSLENGVNAREALLKGLCDDGGLYVSDELLTCVLTPDMLKGLTYRETALRVFSVLLSDFTKTELAEGIERAYADNFASVAVTPVTRVGDEFLLELHHGPTSAFKDVALCMLPQLMSAALKDTGRRVMIATATSGDTGKAALSGFMNVPGIGITVFYPHGKVSDIQYLQMATQEGRNVAVAAVEGNFDDVQSTVKKIFASDLRQELADEGVELSSANSINIGRLVPQVVYYFDAYRQLVEANEVEQGAKVDFCVPTGNFGDVLAGYYAYRMGLPVRHFIVASNANNVLTDFLTTGVYDRNRPFVKTITPSMDILISSNLERMLYYASEGDTALIARLMENLRNEGVFRVEGEMLERIRSLFKCGARTAASSTRTPPWPSRSPASAPTGRCRAWCSRRRAPSSSAATSTSRSLAGRLKAIPTASHTWTRFPGSRVKTPPRLLQGCARCPCSTRTSCVPRAWPTSSARPSRAHSDRGGRT